MNHLWPDQAPYTVCNSCLSEYGVLGGSDSAGRSGGPWDALKPKRGLHLKVSCLCHFDHGLGLGLGEGQVGSGSR